MEKYNVNQLFEIAFGIKSIGTYSVEKINKGLDYESRLSALGTNMIVPIKFKGKGYNVYNDFGEIVTQRFEDFELPASTLVNLRRAKIISKTKVSAERGTVKEIYGWDDWRIDIRGFCLADESRTNAQSAREQKVKINEFDAIADSIQVISELFQDFNIDNISIEEIQFSQLKGKPGVIPFYIKCSSDEPLSEFL